MAYQSFEDLEVWRRSLDQAAAVFESLEDCRKYSLRNQMERSSVSVPSNIAEGQERDYTNEFVRFLRIAKGSNGELRTQLLPCRRLRLLEPDTANHMINENKEISAMLQGLIRSLDRTSS